MDKTTKIEIFITVSTKAYSYLFDYNQSEKDLDSFKAIKFKLPLPSDNSTHYYFFHLNRNHNQHFQPILIEFRKNNFSDLNSKSRQSVARHYKLLCGIQLKRKIDGCFIWKAIQAFNITQKGFNNQYEALQQEKSKQYPYYVVRSFRQGFRLRQNQQLKIGRKHLLISHFSPGLYNLTNSLGRKDTLQVKHQIQGNPEDQDNNSEEVKCRFCMNQQKDMTTIFVPCKCIGSVKYVHIECLKYWLSKKHPKTYEESFQDNPVGVSPPTSLTCQICKAVLPKIVKVGDKTHYLLDIYKKVEPFVRLQQIHDSQGEFRSYLHDIKPDNVLNIGRHQDNHILLSQQSVSRYHSKIVVNEEEQIVIKDKESKFGTLMYDPYTQVKLSRKATVVQIQNVVIGLKLLNNK